MDDFASNYFFTHEAQVIPTTTGTISALSSMLVISIIVRSQHLDRGDIIPNNTNHTHKHNPGVTRCCRKLSSPLSMSTYHLIMFFFSFWDIITSIAIALTTIPMPADIHETYKYPFASNAYGTAGTCKTQSFLILMGQSFTICSNIFLSVFYLCSIRYGMTETTMKRKLVPAMLALSCVFSIPVAIAPLITGVLNPSPMLPYCTIGIDPSSCMNMNDGGFEFDIGIDIYDGDSDENCDDTQERRASTTRTAIGFLNVVMLLMMIVCLILVILTISETKLAETRAKIEGEAQKHLDHTVQNGTSTVEDNYDLQDVTFDDENGTVVSRAISGTAITFSTAASSRYSTSASGTRANEMLNNSSGSRHRPEDTKSTQSLLTLSLMYNFAYFLTWTPTIIAICSNTPVPTTTFWMINHRFKLVFSPLQGFFNLLIFLYDKVNLLKGRDLLEKESRNKACTGDEDGDGENRVLLSSSEALKIAIWSPSYIPEVLVSNIEKERQDKYLRRKERVKQELMSMRRPGKEKANTSKSIITGYEETAEGKEEDICAEIRTFKAGTSETRLYYEVPPELLRPSFVRYAGSPLSASSSSKQQIRQNPSHSTGFFPRQISEEGETGQADDNAAKVRQAIWDPDKAEESNIHIHCPSNNEDIDHIYDDDSSALSSGSNSTIRRLSFTLHSLLGGFSGALSPIMEIGINENDMEEGEAIEGFDEELSFESALESLEP
jgi:hypothetical protein